MAIPCRRPDSNADTVLPAIASAAAPSYTEGEAVPLSVSLNGTLRTTAGSGGGSGDASLAEQQSQTALLTTIDADTSNISTKIDTLAGAVTAAKVQVDVVSAPTTAVTGTFWQATQPVSAASLPLPTGAATAAKQPALGTAGTASADVITVQGIASMTALKVDGSAVTQPVSGTFWQATQPVSLASVPSHAVTNAGTFATQAAQSGTWTVQPGNTQNTTAWLVTQVPATSGGLLVFRSLDLDETEEEVKGSAGQVYGVWFTNTATTTRWLKFYNATAANVTVGTTTPIITLGLPGNTSDDIAGVLMGGEHGIAFGTAITAAVTTGFADNDTGAPGANDVIINIFYK